MQLGLEVLYAAVSGGDGAGSARLAATGNGLAAGPFVVQRRHLRQRHGFGAGDALLPPVNANAGWSF